MPVINAVVVFPRWRPLLASGSGDPEKNEVATVRLWDMESRELEITTAEQYAGGGRRRWRFRQMAKSLGIGHRGQMPKITLWDLESRQQDIGNSSRGSRVEVLRPMAFSPS